MHAHKFSRWSHTNPLCTVLWLFNQEVVDWVVIRGGGVHCKFHPPMMGTRTAGKEHWCFLKFSEGSVVDPGSSDFASWNKGFNDSFDIIGNTDTSIGRPATFNNFCWIWIWNFNLSHLFVLKCFIKLNFVQNIFLVFAEIFLYNQFGTKV